MPVKFTLDPIYWKLHVLNTTINNEQSNKMSINIKFFSENNFFSVSGSPDSWTELSRGANAARYVGFSPTSGVNKTVLPWRLWPALQLKFSRSLWGDGLRKQNSESSHCETAVAKCKITKGKNAFPFSILEKVPHIVLIFLFQCLQTYSLLIAEGRITWDGCSTGEMTILYTHSFNLVIT